jgi:hypothetical protein
MAPLNGDVVDGFRGAQTLEPPGLLPGATTQARRHVEGENRRCRRAMTRSHVSEEIGH